MKIAIVGAGLTGLTAARELREYAEVKVFESGDVGGLVASTCGSYCIEKFYHHCFRGDSDLLQLIKDLRLSSKLVWKTVKVGFAVDGKFYSLSTPLEILRYPHLTLGEKLRLAVFTLRSRRRNFEDFDDVAVIDGIRGELGESLLEKFFMPLLRAKFGENAHLVSYAWLLARVAIRSNRKLRGEEIGYLRGGFQQLVERLAEGVEIVRKHARIRRAAKWEVNGENFDAVIYTAPIAELSVVRLPRVRYQSSICVLAALRESVSDLYWVNCVDAPFGALIEHTNFMPLEDYGEHLVYLASYSTPDGELFRMSDDGVLKLFMKGLARFGVEERAVRWAKVFRAKYSGPIYERGYATKITPYKVADGFYVAGMTSKPNYPERSMNGSVRAGKEVAEIVRREIL